jgi:hypothetical protein
MKMANKINGFDSAIIAVLRYKKIPATKRWALNDNGVGESECLTILSLQAMLSPETVTAEEWKVVKDFHELHDRPDNGIGVLEDC